MRAPPSRGGWTGARLVGCPDRSERHSAGLPHHGGKRNLGQTFARCPSLGQLASAPETVVAPRRTSHGGPVALPRRMRARTSRGGLRCVTWTRLVLDYPRRARQDGGPRGRAAARAASATSVRAKSACWLSLRRRPPTCGLCTTTTPVRSLRHRRRSACRERCTSVSHPPGPRRPAMLLLEVGNDQRLLSTHDIEARPFPELDLQEVGALHHLVAACSGDQATLRCW